MFGIHRLLQRLKRRKHMVVLPLSEGAKVGVTVKRRGWGGGVGEVRSLMRSGAEVSPTGPPDACAARFITPR